MPSAFFIGAMQAEYPLLTMHLLKSHPFGARELTMEFAQLIMIFVSFLFPAVLIYAGIMDILTLKIKNYLVLGLVIGYFACAPFAGFTIEQVLFSLLVAAIVFAVTFVMFALGWIGGGDAKMATALALWFGWDHALVYFLYATLAGGAFTIFILIVRSRFLPATWLSNETIMRIHTGQLAVPYGAAFALAALIVFPHTQWFTSIA